MRFRTALLVTAVALLAVAAAGTATAATTVTGCTEITSPGTYELTTDVAVGSGFDGNCLRVNASGAVLDGADNAVVGPGTGDGTGVRVGGGATNVTVRGLNVTGWGYAIHADGSADGVTIERNDVVASSAHGQPAILLEAGSAGAPSAVVENDVRQNWEGIRIGGAPETVVRDNRFVANDHDGIVVSSSNAVAIRDNLIAGSQPGVESPHLDGSGVYISLSGDVRIEGNRIQHNANGVMLLFLAGVSRMRDNRVLDNERGVLVYDFGFGGAGLSAHCNRFEGNLEYGVRNDLDTAFNVTRNYWGARSGPGGGATDAVTGATAGGAGDNVSADLEWDPFLSSPGCGDDGGDGGEDNEPPEADLDLRPERPAAGTTVVLDGADSTDPDGTVVEYDWEIDGADAGHGERLRHVFEEPHATHTVTLTVTDDDGATDVVHREVTVTEDDGCEEREEGPEDGDEDDRTDEDDDDDGDDCDDDDEEDDEGCEDDGEPNADGADDDCEEEDDDCEEGETEDCDEGDDGDGEDEETVTVCHVTPSGERTLTIPEPSLEGHLGHGDHRGRCDRDGPGGATATEGGEGDSAATAGPTTVASPSEPTGSPPSLFDRVIGALGELVAGLV